MSIILNENKYAEEIIKEGKISSKPSETLNILARYYYQLGKDKKEIYALLEDFMRVNYLNFNPVKWTITIERQVQNSGKYPLVKVDCVEITKNELETISSINNKKLERLAFTMLCLAKFHNKVNKDNNDWVNQEDKEIFKLARVPTTIVNQSLMMNDLKNLGLVKYSKKVNNININVLFIDDDSDVILKIIDFRELGYEYLAWKGENFIRCFECGILMRKRSNNNTYCKDCGAYQPVDRKTVICIDCGEKFEVDSRNMTKVRCDKCQKAHRQEWDRNRKRNYNE